MKLHLLMFRVVRYNFEILSFILTYFELYLIIIQKLHVLDYISLSNSFLDVSLNNYIEFDFII